MYPTAIRSMSLARSSSPHASATFRSAQAFSGSGVASSAASTRIRARSLYSGHSSSSILRNEARARI